MSTVSATLAEYTDAHRRVVEVTKAEIKAALREAFQSPGVESIVFGVCTAPFNDENPGQGVFGPLVNTVDKNEDGEFEDAFGSRDDSYALFYDHFGRKSSDPRISRLVKVLEDADWEFVSKALGVSYYPEEGSGSQSAFVATRRDAEGAYYFYEHEIDY